MLICMSGAVVSGSLELNTELPGAQSTPVGTTSTAAAEQVSLVLCTT